jgi:PKD repeat protein
MKKLVLLLIFVISQKLQAQTCQASFIYSQGANGVVTFTNTSTATSAHTGYYWMWGDGYRETTLVNDTILSYMYYYNQTYTVSLTITDSTNGCSNSVTNTVVVTTAPPCNIHASLGTTYSTQPIPDTTLLMTTIVFSNTSTGVEPDASYTYNCGNGEISSVIGGPGVSIGAGYPYSGQYIATLIVTGGGCISTAADTFNVTGGLTCSLTANYTDTLRSNGQVDFYNISTGVLFNMKAIWYYGDGTLPDTTNTPSHSYAYNGTYRVKLYMLDYYHQCKDSIVKLITVTNAPNTCIGVASPTYTLAPAPNGVPHTWFAIPNYSSQVTHAVWSWGDGTSTAGLYPYHMYAAAGNYNICVKVYFVCGDSASYCQTDSLSRVSSTNQIVQISVVSNITGIKQAIETNNHVVIYPNPSNGTFTIEASNYTDNTVLTIYNSIGQLVYTTKLSQQIETISTKLAPGIYSVRLQNAQGTGVQRIIITE